MSNCIEAAENCSVELGDTGMQIIGMIKVNLVPTRNHSPSELGEPELSELIDDPVLHAVMARDGIGCADLVGAIDVARARLGLGPWGYCCAC
jgi:hypothetical protein